jgi:hypothetical protein
MSEIQTETFDEKIKRIRQEIDDEETVAEIVEQFQFSATGKHLPEELKADAGALLQELQKRLAVTTNPDEQLALAREARAAWHKAL